MTQDDARRLKADALLEFQDAKQRLAQVKARASKMAMELGGLSSLLESQPTNISVESYATILDHGRLVGLVSDMKRLSPRPKRRSQKRGSGDARRPNDSRGSSHCGTLNTQGRYAPRPALFTTFPFPLRRHIQRKQNKV